MEKYSAAILCTLFAFAGLFFFVTPSTAAENALTCTKLPTTFSWGAQSSNVLALQNFLQVKGFLSVEPTGYFGNLTVAAVKSFQANQGLETVGSAGPLTRAAIQKISCATTTAAPVPVPTPAPTPTPAPAPSADPDPDATDAPSVLSLPYHAPIFTGWQGTWGDVATTTKGTLLISAATTTTGAEVQFPGSSDWTDYSLTANFLITYSDMVVYGRYVDPQNFLTCTFAQDGLYIQQRVNGVTKTVATASMQYDVAPAMSVSRSTSVSMSVKGNTITCSADPQDTVIFTAVDPALKEGGIGFTIWNPNNGFASEELYNLDVEAL